MYVNLKGLFFNGMKKSRYPTLNEYIGTPPNVLISYLSKVYLLAGCYLYAFGNFFYGVVD